ncbi:L,D-transpeptidase family protein [Fodinicola acaciae]|uniref:L,D-transpeptidase family protein n=1 Tax=Fodinicola acaciae TaxID=2681555 RepID=UPI0013D133F6|nr:L,D-transpeptidase family protein [Fodinicola acaciae]
MARRTVIGLAVAAVVVLTATGAGVAYATGVIPRPPRPVQKQVEVQRVATEPADTPATPEMPPTKPSPTPAANTRGLSCGETGPAQAAVERYLDSHPGFGKVVVDGRQSPQDCVAIAKFQQRFRIMPAKGYAGKVTGNIVKRLAAARLNACDTRGKFTVCVDLTSQTMWVNNGGKIAFGPTPIRTGRAGLATPPGHFSISDKKKSTISSYFRVRLPYWQRFHADMGFHQTTTYLYEGDSPGSHGCINLLRGDASKLYSMTTSGTHVHVFGKKPV